MTREEMFLKFAMNADVRAYNPVETLGQVLGRDFTMRELAEYIAEIRQVEAEEMVKRFWEEKVYDEL